MFVLATCELLLNNASLPKDEKKHHATANIDEAKKLNERYKFDNL